MGNLSSSEGNGLLCSSKNKNRRSVQKYQKKVRRVENYIQENRKNNEQQNNGMLLKKPEEYQKLFKRQQYFEKLGLEGDASMSSLRNSLLRSNSFESLPERYQDLIIQRIQNGEPAPKTRYEQINSEIKVFERIPAYTAFLIKLDESTYMDREFDLKQSELKDLSQSMNFQRSIMQTVVSTKEDSTLKMKLRFPQDSQRSHSLSPTRRQDTDSDLRAMNINTDQDIKEVEEGETFSVIDASKSFMLSYVHIHKNNQQGKIVMKSTDKIRQNYLSKLAYQKLWVSPQNRPKIHQTCIIFDWDDTILCTSFLAPYPSLINDPNRKIPKNLKHTLEELDNEACQLLSLSKRLGQTFIITNALEGWVESSSYRFLPKVFQQLSGIQIISARSKYQDQYPTNYKEWKMRAFLDAQVHLDKDAITNLVAIGDNAVEIDAAYHLASQFNHAFIKTVKFRKGPKPYELTKQITLLLNQFEQIVTSPKNLTVRLQKINEDTQQEKAFEDEKEDLLRQQKLQMKRQQRIEQQKQEWDKSEPIVLRHRSVEEHSYFNQETQMRRNLSLEGRHKLNK